MVDPFSLFLLFVSPAVGSFLGVLADRLPRGENVVHRRSFCRSCGGTLSARDLVPILSFATHQGQCRHCTAPIPPWTLYLEILALAAAIFALFAGGSLAEVVFSVLFLWLLLGLATADVLWLRLPDVLTGALFVWVLVWAWIGNAVDITSALAGAALGAGSFLMIRLTYQQVRGREGLGMGDVKLMAGLGAYAGPFDVPLLVLCAALCGLVWGARSIPKNQPFTTVAIPFGTMLCLAGALLWLGRATGLLI